MVTKGPYKMGTLSRLTGLSPILLRAWERRHALLQPERGPGGHRLYTDDDLAVLRKTQRLISEGRSIGEVAALGRTTLLLNGGEPKPSGPAPHPATAPENELERMRGDIVAAALRLDAEGLTQALDQAAAAFSITTFVERVIEPATREIGRLWQAGECTIASEHLASAIFVHRVRKLLEAAEVRTQPGSPVVLAACLPGEEHQLGLLVLSYFLSQRGIRVLFFGANLPIGDLVEACRTSSPAAVLLSVTRKKTFTHHRDEIRKLLKSVAPKVPVYLGGAGAPADDKTLVAFGLWLSPRGESANDAAARIANTLHLAKTP